MGDDVFGSAPFPGRYGSFAELVVVPEGNLVHKPARLPFREAAGVSDAFPHAPAPHLPQALPGSGIGGRVRQEGGGS